MSALHVRQDVPMHLVRSGALGPRSPAQKSGAQSIELNRRRCTVLAFTVHSCDWNSALSSDSFNYPLNH